MYLGCKLGDYLFWNSTQVTTIANIKIGWKLQAYAFRDLAASNLTLKELL